MRKLLLASTFAALTAAAGTGCRLFDRDRDRPSHSYHPVVVPHDGR